MGAQPYFYMVPYEDDVEAALVKLRDRVFESKEFRGAEFDPASAEEAFEMADADGTGSILDIGRVSETPDYGCAAPFTEEDLERHFGTTTPSEADVRESFDFWDDIERGMARYLVLYEDGRPSHLMFAGYSFD